MRNKRIILFSVIIGLVWLGMMGRVFYIQVIKGDYYANMTERQTIRRNIIQPMRGEILDRQGRKLVLNAEVEVDYADGDKNRVRKLKRVSPYGYLAGQVLGNLGRDGYGQLGLEYDQDKILRGSDGWQYARYDVKRKYYPGFKEQKQEPKNGVDIISSLDLDIQRIAERALERGVKRTESKGGVALVVDPHTGDILAMANYPFYNPNHRSKKDLKAWKNKVISKTYEPGSTFKIITAAATIEEGVVAPDEIFNAEEGYFEKNGAKIRDTKPKGDITFTQAMSYSSNIVMVKAADRLAPQKFYKYIRSFGFGMKSGIDLPAEEGGYLNPVKRWNARSQVTLAWGQELSVTPLQLTMAVSAIANGGELLRPRIILEKSSLQGEGRECIPVRKVRRVVSRETASALRKMLTTVVTQGTAKGIYTDRYVIAGKTGTVEKIDPVTKKYLKGKFHSSFVGMVPAESPIYVCLVLMDEPRVHKYGGSAAAPVFREIMDRIHFLEKNPLAPKTQIMAKAVSEKAYEWVEGDLKADVKHASFSLGSSPIEGKKIPKRDKPSGIMEMPNLQDKSLRDALMLLNKLPLEIDYTGIGQVINQFPTPGTTVKPGQKCKLQLGRPS